MAAVAERPTHAELLRIGEGRLRDAGVDSARLDAEVLLALALGIDRAGLYARLRASVPAATERHFAALLDRRAGREPVAYITGTQEFWSLPFAVTPAVLIPRPETERLVELVSRLSAAAGDALTVCDVGTGSGCVAVAILRELPAARVVAVDISAAAVALAARNAAAHGVADRISVVASDLFDALDPLARFDLIVSNPPYLSPDDPVLPELAFEPSVALVAGADGLAVIRRLIAAAAPRLRAGGWLVMELGCGQEAAVCELAEAAGFEQIDVEPDLAGIPRVVTARNASPRQGARR